MFRDKLTCRWVARTGSSASFNACAAEGPPPPANWPRRWRYRSGLSSIGTCATCSPPAFPSRARRASATRSTGPGPHAGGLPRPHGRGRTRDQKRPIARDEVTLSCRPMHPNSPQAKEMADESMVRNLAAQIEAIWPQEKPIFERHPPPRSVLDVGCGTGEVNFRLASLFAKASFTGVDLEEAHLDRASAKNAPFGDRVRFQRDDAMHLSLKDAQFDLAMSRHVLQALPDAPRAVQEMVRVLKPGGRLHLIAEDYGMLWCHPTGLDSDGFWQRITNG